ncbi:NAD(+) diphosphatase [Aestuariibacter salexigens]|uniref:NAD(+) diphosphatase n=1 Tax=Aestuariibacter salexigens TaxID=226010 RepID=UPI00041E726D|nr:NAD(+) diphosphatase [Aestuariibacter salexigens]
MQITNSAHGYWFIFSGDRVLQPVDSDGPLLTQWSSLNTLEQYSDDVTQFSEIDTTPCYFLDLGAEQPSVEGMELVSLRRLLMQCNDQLFEQAARAWQLVLFYRTHRFCGQCGSASHRVDWEYATQCHSCGHRCYPRVSPCIIAAIRDGDKILLALGKRHVKTGMYSTLAGFVESGESLEQAVHREIMEEVSVRVKNLEYFGSQPWPFPHSLMVGFLAEYDGGEIVPEPDEIEDAKWFAADNLPLIPPTFSIAGRLIEETLKRIKSGQ